MQVKHFRSADEFRRWLQRHHATETELWVGFYRKGCGQTGMSYPDAVDQALCFGWIDGVRKKVDEISYTNRFSPRQPKSNWSTVNIRRVGELTRLGLMADAGLAAFKARDEKRSGVYSFENRPQSLPRDLEKVFKANTDAWAFWTAQPPGYRRTLTWYVVSAVKDETRQSRLAKVIESSARGQRLGLLSPSASAKATADKSKQR
jgi:uncharacterized protein YdeI (YjbR/CyaY-like superfamily)